MLDLLLIPALLLVALGLRAVHRGDHRLHGQLMTAAITVVALRMVLWPRTFSAGQLKVGVLLLCLAAATLLLGRKALAWREGRSRRSHAPRLHRASGILTLISFALALVVWLLRDRG